ncbi:MAG: hypothetical protein OXC60_10875 [Litoreibacter sp.]|nr:hypothetical protein [Litoreibacter sp.]
MFLELIAVFVAGIACAGIALMLIMISGRRLPRWITPIAAGAGMIAITISSEYSWFDRTSARLPEGVAVATTVEEKSWVRPWTQIWPYTKRFVAVDQSTARSHAEQPDQKMVDLYFFGRWSPVNRAPMLFDCAGNRSALLIDGADFAEDGSLKNAEWDALAPDDPILTLACEA